MNMLRFSMVVLMLFVLSGCVSKPVVAENECNAPPLMIAQNGDGDVIIEWESEPGYLYTIYYQATADADWKVLKGMYRVPGTGQRLTAYDHVNPSRPPHRYRVLPEEQE